MDTKNISWPGWETVGIIGRGSFGAVYEIQRDVFGDVEKAALKVISIPQHESDIDEMYSDGYDDESITSTFQNHLKSIVAEYTLMKKMSNSANIVHSDDIRYIQHENGFGWDIFIKMELLTPLTKALPADIPEETVVKLAKDMCAALELCRKHGVVHRDIKPQNIFLSPDGEYKLGDFGIAKTVEKTMGGTKIGTYKYMAPEVYNNQPYGMGADIYSLGLVLYWMLNERRMPFLPLPPEKLSSGVEERARNRRFSGEPLPEPAHGSADLKKIVLKACAFDPKERYSSAAEMLQDLNAGFGSEAVRRRKEEARRRDREEQERLRKEREEQERLQRELAEQERLRKEKEEKQHKEKEAQEHAHEEKKPAGNKKWIVAAALVLVCIICGALFFARGEGKKNTSVSQQQGVVENVQTSKDSVVVAGSNILAENFEEVLFDSTAERNKIEEIRFLNIQKNAPSSAKDVSQNRDGSVCAWVSGKRLYIAGNGKVVAPENCKGLFSGYRNVWNINFYDCFDTSQVTNMSHMFSECDSLTTLNLYVFDTSNVTDMSSMFENCKSLVSVDFGEDTYAKVYGRKLDTSKVTDMRSMFSGCSSLAAIDLRNFDTSNVTNMNSMFYGCKTIRKLNVDDFDTAQVLDMGSMFYGCESLDFLYLGNFDTSKVTRMSKMFYWCDGLFEWNGRYYTSNCVDIRNWDVSNVIACNDFIKIKDTTHSNPKIYLDGKPWVDYFH